MRPYSLKRRLILSVLVVEMISALAMTSLALVYERHSRFRAFEIMLRGRADSLLGAVQDAEDDQDSVILDGTEERLPKTDIYAVWDSTPRLIGHSANWRAPSPPIRSLDMKPTQRVDVDGRVYRLIRVEGLRIIDPRLHGAGIPRPVTILYGSPIAPIWREIGEAVEFYAATSLALLLTTGLLMFWLLRRGLEPLEELAVQASAVSVHSWAFTPSDEIRNTLELAPLAQALDNLLQGLERSFSQQRHFVSDAAHELKTSVAVIKSSLQLLAMRPRSTAEYQSGIELCQADTERLEQIVANMLTLARVEAERPLALTDSCMAQATDPGSVIRELFDVFRSMAELKGIRLELSEAAPMQVSIERDRWELLCSNLLLNAIQHSHANGVVQVSLTPDSDSAELRIRDYGRGIDGALLPFVFDRFYRGDSSRSRRTGGTGLGLAIAKAIVLGARGTIEMMSTPGEGTTVIVRLPRAAGDPQSASSDADGIPHRDNHIRQ